jgi:hypothetical protein
VNQSFETLQGEALALEWQHEESQYEGEQHGREQRSLRRLAFFAERTRSRCRRPIGGHSATGSCASWCLT